MNKVGLLAKAWQVVNRDRGYSVHRTRGGYCVMAGEVAPYGAGGYDI